MSAASLSCSLCRGSRLLHILFFGGRVGFLWAGRFLLLLTVSRGLAGRGAGYSLVGPVPSSQCYQQDKKIKSTIPPGAGL